MGLLERNIFNTAAMRKIAGTIEAITATQSEDIAGERDKLQISVDELSEAINNITKVIMSGMISIRKLPLHQQRMLAEEFVGAANVTALLNIFQRTLGR